MDERYFYVKQALNLCVNSQRWIFRITQSMVLKHGLLTLLGSNLIGLHKKNPDLNPY